MTSITLKKTYASLPRTVRGKAIVINGDPKGKNFLYCNGNNIFIRNIDDVTECDVYAEHSKETTVAKYSPSGFYIASADISGKVRVWDTVNPEHILKAEHHAIAGAVKDLDWTSDNGKILAGGEGRENFGRAFMFDSGSSAGDISGHTKSINSVSFKSTRPFRCATASEDYSSIFYEGPPFKFKCSKDEHSNFVNCVRYSPNGEVYVTAGADGKMFLYDGKTSDLMQEIGAPKAHGGGIYAICFNKDGSKLLSVSGDKSAKIWNMESKSVETEFKLGTTVTDMQVGCLWQGDNILSVSLSGNINYLDPVNPASPKRIIKGHNKPICSLAVAPGGDRFYTAASDGLILSWNANTGEAEEFKGKGHTNLVCDLCVSGDQLVSIGIDDTIRFTSADSLQYGDSVKLDSQPKAVDVHNGIAVVACINHIVVLESPGRKLSTTPMSPEPYSVSIRAGGAQVAVGSQTHVHIFEQGQGGQLSPVKSIPAEDCCAVRYSPDGALLAVSSKNSIMVFEVDNDFKDCVGAWGKQHSAKVTSIAWSPDSRRFASGGIDTHVIVWTHGDYMGKKPMVKAHALSYITSLKWLDNNSVITVGNDSNTKVWAVSG